MRTIEQPQKQAAAAMLKVTLLLIIILIPARPRRRRTIIKLGHIVKLGKQRYTAAGRQLSAPACINAK